MMCAICSRSVARFQAPWLARDRQIHDLLADGDKRAAGDAMSLYLDDSEHLLLQMLAPSSHH